MKARLIAAALCLLVAACGGREDGGDTASDKGAAPAGDVAAPKAWSEAVDEATRREGFVDLYVDASNGKVLAVFPKPDGDGVSLRAIHAAGLTAGLGSNPIGLDRGLFDGGSLIAFRRVGPKIIAETENWTYRASSDNPLEQKAVQESFARSFIWSAPIIAENEAGDLLVDLTSFLLRDALSVKRALADHPGGGEFSLAEDRSLPDFENLLAFKDNIELDAFLTFVGDRPKSEVNAVSADGRSITVVQHQSLMRLPEAGFKSRMFDPRAAAIDVPYYDFSAPLDGQIKTAFARRFRLQKQDPAAASSPAREPIVFYVDSGAPDQIRDALIEGASWWADAFEAAGFPDSYRVEPLPEGAHPRDMRYNVISWTHRQTRGWSYGGGVHDPRTGEMLKASVILGSQRVRQDRMILEGLAGADATGSGGANDPVEVSLQRIRQLSAHEVGHTLGFAHNFAASSNDRASVMDYPAPLVRVGEDGAMDFSQAYDDGIGEWDKVAATWLYSEFAGDVDEEAALNSTLEDAYGRGLRFVGDSDARSNGTAHPYGSVWDNGEDAVAELEATMAVRAAALSNFGTRSIQSGEALSRLREVIVPVYLYHRYQLVAAAKSIGGYEFAYKTKGDALPDAAIVDDARQRRALAAVAATLDPSVLMLSEATLSNLSPPIGAFAGGSGGEVFDGETGPVFDLLAAADTAGALTMGALLHPDRLARVYDFHTRDPSRIDIADVFRTVEAQIFSDSASPRERAIAERLQTRFVSVLMSLSAGGAAAGEAQASAVGLSGGGGATASPAVQAATEAYLKSLRARLAPGLLEGARADRAHRDWLVSRIDRHLSRPAPAGYLAIQAPQTPPGSPIGEDCWHCETQLN